MNDPVKLRRETIKIEGGRNLYNYTFEVEEQTSPPGHLSSGAGEGERKAKGNLKPQPEEKK